MERVKRGKEETRDRIRGFSVVVGAATSNVSIYSREWSNPKPVYKIDRPWSN